MDAFEDSPPELMNNIHSYPYNINRIFRKITITTKSVPKSINEVLNQFSYFRDNFYIIPANFCMK